MSDLCSVRLPSRLHVLLRKILIAGAMPALATALALLSASLASAHGFKAGAIEIQHPWSRAIPPGAPVAGGYLVLVNKGTEPDRLVSATVEIAGRAQLHEMADKAGVMTMRPVPEGLTIPPGATVALKPGSYHLMFSDLNRPPKQGEKFAGTLTFEKAGTVDVSFAVEAMAATGDDHSGHAPAAAGQ